MKFNGLNLCLSIFFLLLTHTALAQWGCGTPDPVDPLIVNNVYNDDHLVLLDAYCAWTLTYSDPNIVVGVVDVDFDSDRQTLKAINGIEMRTPQLL